MPKYVGGQQHRFFKKIGDGKPKVEDYQTLKRANRLLTKEQERVESNYFYELDKKKLEELKQQEIERLNKFKQELASEDISKPQLKWRNLMYKSDDEHEF